MKGRMSHNEDSNGSPALKIKPLTKEIKLWKIS